MTRNLYNDKQSNINILNTLAQCSYPTNFRDFVSNIIMELSNAKGTQFYKVNRSRKNVTDTIIVVKYLIHTTFNNKIYEIPILIYIGRSFPYEAPEIYLERTSETGVNPKNLDIDANTFKITTTSLKAWNQFCTIPNVLTEIQGSFNKFFPIYKVSSKQQLMPQNQYDNSQVNNAAQNIDFGGQNSQQPTNVYNQPTNNIYNQGKSPLTQNPYVQDQNNNNISASRSSVNYNQPSNQPQPQVQPQYQPQTKPQSQSHPSPKYIKPQVSETPEEGMKRVLIEEIMSATEGKIKEEVKRIKQQEEKLTNFKNDFSNHIEKYQKVLSNSSKIQSEFQNMLKTCEAEINSIKNYLAENSSKEMNSKNVDNFILIANQKLLRLVSIEASIEDLMAVLRKAYEKQVMSFEESLKLIRSITREAMKIKFYREELTKKL